MPRASGRATPRTNIAGPTERAADMWSMRVRGMSTGEIAAEYGITPQRVGQVLKKYAKDLVYPHVSEYRQLQIERLEFLWNKLVESGKLAKGDPQAIAVGVRIAERYAKLLGLDAPTQIQAQIDSVDPREIELRSMILEAKAVADSEIAAIRGETCTDDYSEPLGNKEQRG